MPNWFPESIEDFGYFEVRYESLVSLIGNNEPVEANENPHAVLGELYESKYFMVFLYLHELSKDYKPITLAKRLNFQEGNGSKVRQVEVDPTIFASIDPPLIPLTHILEAFIKNLAEGLRKVEWAALGSRKMMQKPIGEIIDYFNSDAANNTLPTGRNQVIPVLFNSKYALGSMLRPLSISPDNPWGDSSEQYRAIPLGSLLATSFKLQFPEFNDLLELFNKNGFSLDSRLAELPQSLNIPPFPFKNGLSLGQ